MRRFLLFVMGIVACWNAAGIARQGRPVPPGVREAEKKEDILKEPPVVAKRKPPDAAQLKQEADELAKLSATIPDQIGLIGQGQLPKDLAERLKRIEKVAKQLRTEILA